MNHGAPAAAWPPPAPQSGAPKSFDALEAELLKGQKLQGVLTSNEVQEILKARRAGLRACGGVWKWVRACVSGVSTCVCA
jgi:hypothetical protein